MNLRPKMARRLGVLAVVLLLIVAGGIVVWRVQAGKAAARIAAARVDGMKAFEARDYPTALRHLSFYVGRTKTVDKPAGEFDVDAVYAYGRSRQMVPSVPPADRFQHLREAEDVYERILPIAPADVRPRHALLEVYPTLARFPEAEHIADELLGKDPKDVLAMRAKVQLLARRPEKLAEAYAACRRLNEAHPLDVRGQMMARDLQLQLKTPADQMIARATALKDGHPDDPRAELVLGAVYLSLAQSAEGSTSQREGWAQDANKWLAAAAGRTPPDGEFVRQLVNVLDRFGNFSRSLELLKKAVATKDLPDEEGWVRRTFVQRSWENLDTKSVLEQTAGLDPANPASDARLLGYRAITLSEGDAAQKAEAGRIQTALSAEKDDPVAAGWSIALEARLANPPPDARELVKKYQSAVAKDAENAVACYLAGEAYQTVGETENAARMFEAATQRSVSWGLPHALVARVRLAGGRNEEALRRATMALQRAPTFRPVLAVYVLAKFASLGKTPRQADMEELLGQVAQIQQAFPNDAETLPLYVTLLARNGKKTEAVEAARKAATATPPASAETMLRLEAVGKAEGIDLGEALAATAAGSTTPAVALRRSIDLLNNGDAEAGLLLLQDGRKAAGNDSALQWRLAIATYRELSDDPDALKEWIEIGDAHPKEIGVQTAILSASSRTKDRAFWKKTIDRVHELTGDDGVLWRTEQARWDLAGSDPAQKSDAVARLTELARQNPAAAEVRRLLGLALARQGNWSRAVEELSAAANLRPGDIETSLDLARVQRLAGNLKGSRQLADELAARPDLTPESRRRLASAFEEDGRFDKALAVLNAGASTTQPTPDPARDGTLARLYRRAGKLEEAQTIYLRLSEEPKASAGDLAAGAELFALQGKLDTAKVILQKLTARKLRPGEREAVLARFAERFGSEADAAQQFKAATSAAPGSSEAWRELAGFHLRHARPTDAAAAIAEGLKVARDDADLQALKERTQILAAMQRPADVQPLVDLITREPRNDAAAEMLKILADGQATPGGLSQVADKLRELADRRPDFFLAQEQVIRYYLGTSQPDKAIVVAERAVLNFPFDPEPARLLTSACAATGRWSRMAEAAGQWRLRSPGDPLPADLAMAEALLGQKRASAAVQHLAPYARNGPATRPSDDGKSIVLSERDEAVCRVYVRALIAAGRSDDARKLLEPLLASSADARLVWIGVASANPNETAVVRWLETVTPLIPQDAIAERYALASAWQAAGQALGSTDCSRRGKTLATALTETPSAGPELWNLLARVSLDLGDYDDAERAWRTVIRLGRNDAGMKNNLAYVLLIRGKPEDLEDARKLAEQAIAAAPTVSSFHDTMARIHAAAGRREPAIASYREALARDPDNFEAMIGLAHTLSGSGQKEDAAEAKALRNRIGRILDGGNMLSPPVKQQWEKVQAMTDTGEGVR